MVLLWLGNYRRLKFQLKWKWRRLLPTSFFWRNFTNTVDGFKGWLIILIIIMIIHIKYQYFSFIQAIVVILYKKFWWRPLRTHVREHHRIGSPQHWLRPDLAWSALLALWKIDGGACFDIGRCITILQKQRK